MKIGVRNILLQLFFKKYRRFRFYKWTSLSVHRNSNLEILDIFRLNASWDRNDPGKSFLVLKKNSKLIIDSFTIYTGARITVDENAVLKLGKGYINHNINIACFEKIEIGDNVAISENVVIRDSDNHSIGNNSKRVSSPILIEDNVWIGTNVVILKGVRIGKGSVVAAGAVVTKDIPSNVLVGGVPAKIIRENINWSI